jgi:hypothetical protein
MNYTLREVVAREIRNIMDNYYPEWEKLPDEVKGDLLDDADAILSLLAPYIAEEKRAAFMACAAKIMEPFLDLPDGMSTMEWAEAEALAMYPKA